MGFLGKFIDGITGADSAAEGAKRGAEWTQQGIQQGTGQAVRGLENSYDFLETQGADNRMIGQDAMRRRAGLYGLEGGTGNQQTLIDQAQRSPLYSAITGTREAGEDAIMRNAAATGGLRSGNVQQNLYDSNQRLDERALLASYGEQMQGLESLSGIPNYNMQQASLLGDIGRTQGQGTAAASDAWGQGQVAAGQARGAGRGSLFDTASTLVGFGAGGGFNGAGRSNKGWQDSRFGFGGGQPGDVWQGGSNVPFNQFEKPLF